MQQKKQPHMCAMQMIVTISLNNYIIVAQFYFKFNNSSMETTIFKILDDRSSKMIFKYFTASRDESRNGMTIIKSHAKLVFMQCFAIFILDLFITPLEQYAVLKFKTISATNAQDGRSSKKTRQKPLIPSSSSKDILTGMQNTLIVRSRKMQTSQKILMKESGRITANYAVSDLLRHIQNLFVTPFSKYTKFLLKIYAYFQIAFSMPLALSFLRNPFILQYPQQFDLSSISSKYFFFILLNLYFIDSSFTLRINFLMNVRIKNPFLAQIRFNPPWYFY